MTKKATATESKSRRSDGMRPLKLLAAILAIAAVIKEMRMPKEDRTWHGALVGFVPYDFRRPTVDKIKETFWNPDGPVVVGRPFGIGWTLNFGALVAKVRSLTTSD